MNAVLRRNIRKFHILTVTCNGESERAQSGKLVGKTGRFRRVDIKAQIEFCNRKSLPVLLFSGDHQLQRVASGRQFNPFSASPVT